MLVNMYTDITSCEHSNIRHYMHVGFGRLLYRIVLKVHMLIIININIT